MPVIREYINTQDISAEPLAEAAYHVERFARVGAEEITQGAHQFGAGLKELAGQMQQSEVLDLSSKMSNAELDLTKSYEQAKQTADPTDNTWAQKWFDNTVTPTLDKLGENVESKQAQDYFQRYRNSLQQDFFKRAVNDQAAMYGQASVNAFNSNINNTAKTLDLNPMGVQSAIDRVPMLAEGLPASAKTKAVEEAQQHLAQYAGDGLIEQATRTGTPDAVAAARKLLSDPNGAYLKYAPAGAYNTWQDRLDKADQTIGATNSEIAKIQWPKLLTGVREGDAASMQAAQQFADGYIGSNAKETAVERARLGSELLDAVGVQRATSRFRDMPDPEARAQIPALEEADRAGDKTAKASLEAIRDRDRQFHSDPVSYTLANNDMVRSRAQAFGANPNPQTFAAFAAATSAEQARLYPNDVPKVLPQQMKDDIAGKLRNADTQENGWTGAAASLAQLKNTTGSYWIPAVHELYADHILKPGQYVAGAMMANPQSAPIAGEVLQATAQKDFKDSALTEALAFKMARQSLGSLADTFKGAASTEPVDAYVTSLAAVLRQRSIGTSTADQTMSDRLATTMILNNYHIQDGLRIPANMDPKAVSTGARSVLGDIGNHNLILPISSTGLGPQALKDQYVSDLKSYGSWTTNERGDGAVLLDQQNTPVWEKNKDGHIVPVELKFDEMARLASGK